MNAFMKILFCIGTTVLAVSCTNTRKLSRIPSSTETVVAKEIDSSREDLLDSARIHIARLEGAYADFKTFSAKVKVNYSDANGGQPEGTAIIRMFRDSVIWVSLSGTLLNIEAVRVFITPDSVTIMNKLEKTVEYHPFNYLETVAHIPLTFSTLQDLIVGAPVYVGDSIAGYNRAGGKTAIVTLGKQFRNLLTLSSSNGNLLQSKVEENQPGGRITDMLYDDYTGDVKPFALFREIATTDRSKAHIVLRFLQYEFNNELSISLNVPDNYQKN